MKDTAKVVDKQNASVKITKLAQGLPVGRDQPSGYTEPLLHFNRIKKKSN